MAVTDAGALLQPTSTTRGRDRHRWPRTITWTVAGGVSIGLWALIGFGVSALTMAIRS